MSSTRKTEKKGKGKKKEDKADSEEAPAVSSDVLVNRGVMSNRCKATTKNRTVLGISRERTNRQ